jgi:hypothetical protein
MLFKQVWRGISGDSDAPDAIDEDRDWLEIRGGAVAVHRATGEWPG